MPDPRQPLSGSGATAGPPDRAAAAGIAGESALVAPALLALASNPGRRVADPRRLSKHPAAFRNLDAAAGACAASGGCAAAATTARPIAGLGRAASPPLVRRWGRRGPEGAPR